ncbi:MAG: tetratricopeptide repeat protein, partial [Bacteroidota bacterium]
MKKREHIYARMLLILLILCNTTLEAQIAPIKDQADIETYVSHIERLQFQDLDSALLLWQEIGAWSDKHEYVEGEKEYYRIGIYLHGVLLSDKDMGKNLAQEALIFSRKEMPENVPAVWISKAILFQAYTELDSAIAFYEKALQALDHQHPNYPVVLGNLASIYDQLKLAQPAQNYAEEALQIYQTEKDTLGITNSLLTLANVALLEKKADQNFQFLLQAYELSKASSQKASFVPISHNLAYAYIEKGDLSKGLQLFEEALQQSEANPTLNLQSRIGIVRNLIKMNRLTEASNYRDEVISDSAQVAMHLKLRRLLYEMEMEYFQAKGESDRAMGLVPDFLKLKEAEISEESNEYALRLSKQLENR